MERKCSTVGRVVSFKLLFILLYICETLVVNLQSTVSVMKKTAPMPKLVAVVVGFGRRRTDGVTVVATNRLKKCRLTGRKNIRTQQ